MSNKKFETILSDIDELPSLPITVTKVLEISKNPEVTARELNKTISLDPVLTGKVLRLVNSAYYGMRNEIRSIVKAIIMLGINTIRNLCLSSSILPVMNSFAQSLKKGALSIEGYWKHSIVTGVTAKMIAENAGVDKKFLEEYFIAGLLHDIGKLIINLNLQADFLSAVMLAEKKRIPLYLAEREIFGFDHCEVGQKICEKWNLSSGLTNALVLHHNPKDTPEEDKKLVYAIYISNMLTNHNHMGFAGDRNPGEIDDTIMKEMNMSFERFVDWEEKIEQELSKASTFMKIQKGDH